MGFRGSKKEHSIRSPNGSKDSKVAIEGLKKVKVYVRVQETDVSPSDLYIMVELK
jgi:hypothetical protein